MRKIRKIEEAVFKTITRLAAYSLFIILGYIIFIIFKNGFSSLSWEMISKIPSGGYYYGGDGGVLNAIIGSLYIALGATVIAIIIGVPAALFINSHLIRSRRKQNAIRYILDALWGIPSIVYGAFGFTFMVFLGLSASLLAGIFTVSLLITPIVIRTFDDVLSTIPLELHEASLSLGSTHTETAFKVLFKQGFSGFITAVLLAFGRGIGDAASVLFTAGYTDLLPGNLDEPAATLPLAIFFQLGSPIPEVRQRAYAAGVILTVIILIISLTSRFFSNRYKKRTLKF